MRRAICDIPFCILVSGPDLVLPHRAGRHGHRGRCGASAGHTGLQAVLTQMPVLTGVEAVAPSRAILIDGAGLRAMLKDEPSLATALLLAEAMDFRSLVLQVCDLKLRTTAQRLGYYLLELAPDKTSQFRDVAPAVRQAPARRPPGLPAGKPVPRVCHAARARGRDPWRARGAARHPSAARLRGGVRRT